MGKAFGIESEKIHPWHEYIDKCFKKEEFVNIPEDMLYHHDGCLKRFATYDIFRTDMVERFGAIASTTLSILYQPKIVVEFGVHSGWTSLLLSRLNPQAEVHGVDIAETLNDSPVPTGYATYVHGLRNYQLHIMPSWEFKKKGVELCYIDALHTYEAVIKDSWRAWYNRNPEHWCIAWDDYHPSNAGVVKAVDEFIEENNLVLMKIGSWYWTGSILMEEADLAIINYKMEEVNNG